MQSVLLINWRSISSLQKKLLPAPAGATTTRLALSSERSNGSSSTGVWLVRASPTSMPLSMASDGPTNGSVAASALVSRLRGTSS